MKCEADFQAAFLGRMREAGFECQKFQDALQGGIADTFCGRPGFGVWVELKWVPEWPKRPTTKPPLKFRPGQLPWLRKFHGRPLPTGVLIGSPEGWCWVSSPALLSTIREPWTNLDILPHPFRVDVFLEQVRKG